MAQAAPFQELVHPRSRAFEALLRDQTDPAESSSGRKHPPYDVFINHHGVDTKQSLANSIHKKLDATGLRVFLDKNELELGDFFPGALEEAMASASLHIAIFSENYAQSPWCLAELAFILQQSAAIFIPIFYHVEPYSLRWAIEGKGAYANAFKNHEEKGRYSSENLQRWKKALRKASFYNGDIINNQRKDELDACEKTSDQSKRNLEDDDLEVIGCQKLSLASDPNKRRKLIKVLGEDGQEQGEACQKLK